jgi:DNA polymerase-3 subunit alpha
MLVKLNREKEVVGFYISGHPLDDYKLEMNSFCNLNISQIKDLESIKGRDIRIAGMVSEVEHRFTKKGNPFGTITIEDYHDSITFFLFGEDYPKYKPYMTEGWFLYAQCRVQDKKWKEGELEMKIVSVELLSEIKEKTIRSVLLKVNLEDLSQNLFENISELCEEYPGKHNLKFVVNDCKDGYQVGLRSKKYKVNLEDTFLNSLKQISNIELEIN